MYGVRVSFVVCANGNCQAAIRVTVFQSSGSVDVVFLVNVLWLSKQKRCE